MREERTFGNSVSICFRKYVDFHGRAPRSEYWWFVLFGFICVVVIGIISRIVPIAGILLIILELALFLPNLAVSVRRLHDVDRSGWWILISLVPVVGTILLLVWFCTQGTSGSNRFGGDPLATRI